MPTLPLTGPPLRCFYACVELWSVWAFCLQPFRHRIVRPYLECTHLSPSTRLPEQAHTFNKKKWAETYLCTHIAHTSVRPSQGSNCSRRLTVGKEAKKWLRLPGATDADLLRDQYLPRRACPSNAQTPLGASGRIRLLTLVVSESVPVKESNKTKQSDTQTPRKDATQKSNKQTRVKYPLPLPCGRLRGTRHARLQETAHKD